MNLLQYFDIFSLIICKLISLFLDKGVEKPESEIEKPISKPLK